MELTVSKSSEEYVGGVILKEKQSDRCRRIARLNGQRSKRRHQHTELRSLAVLTVGYRELKTDSMGPHTNICWL